MRKFLGAGVAGFGLLMAVPAAAQTPQGETEALRAEVAELKARLAALEARLNAAEPDGADGAAPVAAPPETRAGAAAPVVAAAPPPATPAVPAGTKISWKGAPQISGADGWSFKPRGRIMYDAAYVGSPDGISDPGLGFSNELRRARLGVEGTMPGGFGYKMEVDFANGEIVVTDAFMEYEAGKAVFTVGQHNGFQGLEELTSSNDTSFIERAAFTDAFDFVRRVGASVQYFDGPLIAQAGVFTANVEDLFDDANDAIGGDGRLVYAPKIGRTQLHFGGSLHYHDPGSLPQRVIYRQRPLVHTTDVRFIGTPLLLADNTFGYGLELAAVRGRFWAEAEGFWQHVNADTGFDPTFFGSSVELGMFLTNDTRPYKNGIFKGVKVSDPVSEGGIGAIQAAVRYDGLRLNDGPILGGTQDGYEASLIWTPIDYVRFMMTYGHLVYRDAIIPTPSGNRDYAVDEIGARAQIVF